MIVKLTGYQKSNLLVIRKLQIKITMNTSINYKNKKIKNNGNIKISQNVCEFTFSVHM